MALGDDAVAAGMLKLLGTALANTLDDEINRTRDYIAQRTNAVTPVSKGGTGATDAASARSNLGITALATPSNGATGGGPSNVQADLQYLYDRAATKALDNLAMNDAQKAALRTYIAVIGTDGGTVTGQFNLPNLTAVTSGYVSMYKNGDGRVGISPSARRFKKDITDHEYTLDDALRIRVRDYRLRASVYGTGDAPIDVGVIAEELIEAGLSEFVAFDESGQPLSVHYERLALVALGALQDTARQLDILAERIERLEASAAGAGEHA